MYIVYKRTNNINGKMYIGQTEQTLEGRWANGKGYRGSVKFYAAIQKYGAENFSHEILKENLTKDEADYWERYYIEEFDTVKNGYNLKTGGTHCIYSEASKQKMSKNHADVSGEKNPMYGKKHSLETRMKMSQNRHDKKGSESCFAKKVICITTNKIFNTTKEASEFYDIKSKSHISACCKGKRNYCGKLEDGTKLQWEYYEDPE